ncbi:hypothetical protein FJTKL_11740 [Diaporthe vaccinii]|uniref:Uncharacterized protein n=1 Tax=Diaporthe vaccinii TaxID=105482 RepID=A0ABR4EFZ8_9PEZI
MQCSLGENNKKRKRKGELPRKACTTVSSKLHQSAPHDPCQNINYMPSGRCVVRDIFTNPHPSATPLSSRHPNHSPWHQAAFPHKWLLRQSSMVP